MKITLIMLFSCTCKQDIISLIEFSEEAENERMHLMTVLQLKKPTQLFRLGVIGAQGKLLLY